MSSKVSLFYKATEETVVEYFQKTSLNGFGLLYYLRRRKYQRRVFWFMFIVLGISFAMYVVLFTVKNFLQDPMVTTLESQQPEIWQIPFPAVAICSANRLSRRALHDYVHEISKHSAHYNRDYWLKKMELFVGYYDSSFEQFDEAVAFQSELDSLYEEPFNVAAVLRRLAPPCSELFIKCRWAGRMRDCNELISLHTTSLGYCCMFNYQRGAAEEKYTLYPEGTGIDMGLTVLLNTSTSDYFYTDRSTTGFRIQIFAANNFPDAAATGMDGLLVSPGEDMEVRLSIITQVTGSEAREYSVQKRHCYFADEHEAEYDARYSQTECLGRCKMQVISNACGCVPFYTPVDLINRTMGGVPYCTLMHVECIQRELEQSMFNGVESEQEAETRGKNDALSCAHCLPLCSYNRYSYRKRKTNLNLSRQLLENQKFLGTTLVSETTSLVKLCFQSPLAVQYNKNVLYNWYQILSNIGGVIGICMGCSFISGFELIYFAGFRLYENYSKYRKISAQP